MHCPSCGAPAKGEPKFCRACGFKLEKVAQLMTEQTPPAQDDQAAAGGEQLQGQLQRTERWLVACLAIFVSLLIGGVLWGIIAEVIIKKGHFWQGLGFLLVLASAAAALFFVVRREALQEKLAGKVAPTTSLPPAETTNKLLPEPAFDTIPSVAEPTTRQLAGQPAKDTRQS